MSVVLDHPVAGAHAAVSLEVPRPFPHPLRTSIHRSGRVWLLPVAACLLAACAAPGPGPATLPPDAPGARVVVASLDGMGHRIFREDPAAAGMPALRQVAAAGATADGLVQTFPSGTPGAHAALWTGAWGDTSGITASGNPLLPRSEHTVLQRGSGFDARLLRTEPLWASAAREGVSVVAHQATQSHPFIPFVTADDAPRPPVLVSGYGPPMVAGPRLLRRSDVRIADSAAWPALRAASVLPVIAFEWDAGPLTLYAALVAESGRAGGYDALYVAASPGGLAVRVTPAAEETARPAGRPLARHFSHGLVLAVPRPADAASHDEAARAAAGGAVTVAYFRLYELAADGREFVLFHPELREVAVRDPAAVDHAEVAATLALEAGGFLGNAASFLYRDGVLGPQLYAGGDGRAERRHLETVELVIRQYNDITRWLVRRYEPELLIDYSNYPDEVNHWWYGLSHPETPDVAPALRATFMDLRARMYEALDTRVALLDSIAGPTGTLILTADHGMAPVWREVRVNTILRGAGLLGTDPAGMIHPARTRALHFSYSILVNTTDWRGGIVPPAERAAVIDAAEAALRAVRDPATGEPVFTAFFRPEQDGARLGIGGPAGGDLYFDLAPGFQATDALLDPAVETLPVPLGYHGFLPTRDDMLAFFVARGPAFEPGGTLPRLRALDVAPLVSELLGVRPPAGSVGVTPVRARRGR